MAATDLLRVTRIRVVGLFGQYTHDVPLNAEDRVTIIHGPNGVGKTILLRMVKDALSGNPFDVFKIPFQDFAITFNDGAVLGFRRGVDPVDQIGDEDFICYLEKPGHDIDEFQCRPDQVDPRYLMSLILTEIPWLSRVDEDFFFDTRRGEHVTTAELVSKYLLPSRVLEKKMLGPAGFSDIRSRVSTHLVETHRLLRSEQEPRDRQWSSRTPGGGVSTVRNYARDLKKRISETLTVYAKESQSLDQSFPQRFLKKEAITLSVDELKTRMKQLEIKQEQLKRIGLIDEDPASRFDEAALNELEEMRRNAMTLYVEDAARKLSTLDDIARRIMILLDNINSKFAHKSIIVDRKQGLIVRTDHGQTIELDALSSGEQHELVLLYDLLFEVEPNTLVLIDEPEMSLHLIWQTSFLPDLLEIVKTAGYDVVLATHSPYIAGYREDLMVDLNAYDDAQKVEDMSWQGHAVEA